MGSRPSTFPLTQAGPFRLYSTAELLTLPPPKWLIDTILPEGGLCTLYGPPESFKSFVALDLALCVASGRPWHGYEVQQGHVLYVAAEGGPGIGKRVRAWLLAQGLSASTTEVAWLIESLSIFKDSTDMALLLDRIAEIERIPRLIVIDTLARCFDGDENQQEDMGRFVAGLDRLRHEYGSTLLAIHHTRLDGDRERGNTALRGGTDTMMSITRDGDTILLECTKQKDAEHFPSITLKLRVIPEADSCILETEGRDRQVILLGLFENREIALSASELEQKASITGMPRATFYRTLRETMKLGLLLKENGKYQMK